MNRDRRRGATRVAWIAAIAAATAVVAVLIAPVSARVFLPLPGGGTFGRLPTGAVPTSVVDRAVRVNGVTGRIGVFHANRPLARVWADLAAANGDDGVFAAGESSGWGTIALGNDVVRWWGVEPRPGVETVAFALRVPRRLPVAVDAMMPGDVPVPAGFDPEMIVALDGAGSSLAVLRCSEPPAAARDAVDLALRGGGWAPPLPDRDSRRRGAGLYVRGRRWIAVGAAPAAASSGAVVTLWIRGERP